MKLSIHVEKQEHINICVPNAKIIDNTQMRYYRVMVLLEASGIKLQVNIDASIFFKNLSPNIINLHCILTLLFFCTTSLFMRIKNIDTCLNTLFVFLSGPYKHKTILGSVVVI